MFKNLYWKLIKGPIKFWWQRKIRGFDDSELWDLDHTILEFCIPRIRALSKMTISYPVDVSFEDWQHYLEKMARAMELELEYSGDFFEETPDGEYVENKQLKEEFEEGWELFKKYFFALWD